MKKTKTILLTILISIFLIIFIISVSRHLLLTFLFHRNTVKMLRDAPHVKLYVYDNENITINEDGCTVRRFKIYKTLDKEVIEKIWKSVENAIGTSEKSNCIANNRTTIAQILYPTEISYDEGIVEYYPICVFSNGDSHWGVAPDRDATHFIPSLRDCIVKIIELDLEDRFELIDERTEILSIPLESQGTDFDPNDVDDF